MNINDMTKNLDQNKLNRALGQLNGILGKDEMNAIMNALNSPDLGKQLSGISAGDVNRIMNENDSLKKAVSSNPELMNSLNAFLKK